MKRFVYFENQEGGMGEFDFKDPDDFQFLYGWMSKQCKKHDTEFLEWIETAEVGERFHHRLGTAVRLKDKYN